MNPRIDERFIRDFIKKHNISVTCEKKTGDKKTVLILEKCAFNENHTGTESAVIIRPNGTVGYHCEHDSCRNKHIRDFILHYDKSFMFDNSDKQTASAGSELPRVLCVADVEKTKVKYLIEPYIPRNNITALVGDGGIGKTFVWIDFASAVTNGVLPAVMGIPREFTQDKPNVFNWDDDINDVASNPNTTENRKVLYFTSEDKTNDTLRERFEKAGTNLDNLFFVSFDDERFHNILLDSRVLEDLIANVRPALCILDPLQSFVSGKMGERNNMRRQMDCLTRLASVYDTSFVIVVHTNKSMTSDARTKLSDSSDIWDKCRSVLFVGRANGNQRYLSQEKGNYTTDDNRLDTQLFTIQDFRIKHQGTTEKKFFDFATETNLNRATPAIDSAKEFILTSLNDGEMLVSDLDESGKSFGISKTTLNRAKSELKDAKKIKYRVDSKGKDKGTVWYISLYTGSDGVIE